jgi:8-oxo-dGTP diphosphatase
MSCKIKSCTWRYFNSLNVVVRAVRIRAMIKIEVGCAIIRKDGKILIAQRKPDVHLGGYWEFPGGKMEACESLEACLIREVDEELGIKIQPSKLIQKAEHPYPEKIIVLYFYLCDWVSGNPTKKDCEDFRWIEPHELRDFKFPPADAEMIEELINKKDDYFRTAF